MKNDRLLIKNGRVVDPANGIDQIADILIEGSVISKIEKNIPANSDSIIDAREKIVMPGLVDMHVHLREPGREDKETISSATQAALKGGVTSVLAMPNTSPAIDNVAISKQLKSIIDSNARINVYICAAITLGRQGKEIVDVAALKKEGVLALSDDGDSVDDNELMFKALLLARQHNILVICHSEDKSLSARGVVNLGLISTRLGLRGISNESEYKRVARDIELASRANAAVHIAHVSTKESVGLIEEVKKRGMRITCETAPHYFSLSEDLLLGFDTNMKVNPPLRSKSDKAAITEALKSGIIDAIASDHAPHTENEKAIEFERAEFGSIGLETSLSVAITELVHTGLLDWAGLARKMSLNPARILGIEKGTLSKGSAADIVVVDPRKEWVVESKAFASKSKNSAFIGRRLRGAVEYTLFSGKIVYGPV